MSKLLLLSVNENEDDIIDQILAFLDHVNITVRRSRQSGVARATCPD